MTFDLKKFKTNLGALPRRARDWTKRNPKRAIGAGVGFVLLLAFVIRTAGPGSAPPQSFYTVRRGDFLVSVIEGGTLKAVHEASVRCELEGVTRIISIVPEGTYVHKGDLLIELDSADLRDRLNSHELTYQNGTFGFVQGKEALAIQKSVAESNIKDAELRVEFAKSDLEKYIEGDWPQLKKNAETKITIAAEELERAKDHCNWTIELEKKGYATKSELQADTLALKRTEIGLEQAREELRLLEKYDQPKRVRQLQAAVEQADKELERIKQRMAAQIAQAEADLNSRKNTLDLQETRLNQLREQLNLTKIFAPQDGLVVYASSASPGSGILIEEGATVRQKQDIIKLPDVSQMMVEIRVHESHVQKIRPGLPAYITIDSLPDQQFKGSVRKVAVLPDSTSRYYNPNLKVYATEVLIEDEIHDLKPGISGRAEVVITNLSNVLTVPIQTVATVKGRQICFVKKGSSMVQAPVEVGFYNDRLIEIRSGVKEGDQVLLSPLSQSDSIDLSGSIINDSDETNRVAPKKPAGTNAAPIETTGTNSAKTNLETISIVEPTNPPPAAPTEKAGFGQSHSGNSHSSHGRPE